MLLEIDGKEGALVYSFIDIESIEMNILYHF